MKSGCESQKSGVKRTIELPVLPNASGSKNSIAQSKMSRWRAGSLIVLYVLMIAHFIQWRLMGTTVSPIEPSEAMYTLQNGAINAGFIFFTLAILATVIFGRFVCGWGCHIVALQDFCAWLMKKIGITPRPFRSRLLIYVPLIAALYMFVWPTVSRALTKPKDAPLIPGFTNHLVTTEFWATFPSVAVAIPFLFICGFVTVYFLGSKGFCTYGCPYGGFFVLADKVAPGKIRVTDACNQCGHCTATCMSNVQVHAEVAKYGMVVDPGCMKHMDCISVCPNDALYFGFGKPSLLSGSKVESLDAKAGNPQSAIRDPRSSLTWPEEIAGVLIFAASFWAVWDVYQIIPMLMALGIAGITTFLALTAWKMARASDHALHRIALKSSDRITSAGWALLIFSSLWIGLITHSGYVRYHERAGTIAYESIGVPDELALAQADPRRWLNATDAASTIQGKRHLYAAFDAGFIVNTTTLPRLAWLEYLSGNTDQAIKLLGIAVERQEGQARALSLYYRGAIQNRGGHFEDALRELDQALRERNDLVAAHEERGESLWQLARRDEAVEAWYAAIRANPGLPLANNFLAGAASAAGRTAWAARYEQQADRSTPADPYFHWMLGLRLERVGMNTLAEKHFAQAIQLNPQFATFRNLDQK
jgi:tetratricopeptide (TPR) repeat protein/ferredoxin